MNGRAGRCPPATFIYAALQVLDDVVDCDEAPSPLHRRAAGIERSGHCPETDEVVPIAVRVSTPGDPVKIVGTGGYADGLDIGRIVERDYRRRVALDGSELTGQPVDVLVRRCDTS